MNKKGIEIITQPVWTWILNHDCSEEKRKAIDEEFDKEFHGKIGKYLFFSKNREELIELAEKIIVTHNLHHAKTPSRLNPGYSEYVLCVYDAGPNLVQEMIQYATETIKYRYWKSDKATMKGIEQCEL